MRCTARGIDRFLLFVFILPWQQAGAPALHLLLVRLAN
jgi:hypothetical protein